jgi:cytochrome b pre-mRNA-processing protein 3
MIWRRLAGDPALAVAERVYAAIVAQARQPALFRDLGVPDSVDGRFDSLVLHLFVVLRRLKSDPDPAASALSQALCDRLIDDMDRNLREMGVSDLGVGRRVRQMAEGFYGRVKAYDEALDQPGALAPVLARNLYGSRAALDPAPAPIVAAMAAYVTASVAQLRASPLAEIVAARLAFAPAPSAPV